MPSSLTHTLLFFIVVLITNVTGKAGTRDEALRACLHGVGHPGLVG